MSSLPDGTQKIGRVEFPNGENWFGATVSPDGTETIERDVFPDGTVSLNRTIDSPKRKVASSGSAWDRLDQDQKNFLVGCSYGYTTDKYGSVNCNAKPVDVRVVH